MSDIPPDSMAIPSVSIDWFRSTPWWNLLSQSLSIAWRFSHIFIATIGVILTLAAWNLADALFHPAIDTQTPWHLWYASIHAQQSEIASSIDPPLQQFQTKWGIQTAWASLPTAWACHVFPMADIYRYLTLRGLAFALFGFLSTSLIWGLLGAVLARRSVVRLGTRSFIGWSESFRLVLQRWMSLLWTILVPWTALALLMLIPFLLGLLARMGSLGIGLMTCLALLLLPVVLGMGWLGLLGLLGFPLAIVGVVTERKADAFDGTSHAAAYLFQRPVTLAIAVLVSCFVGAVGYWLFERVIDMGMMLYLSSLRMAVGTDDVNAKTGYFASTSIQIMSLLKMGFACSLFWTASSAIYLVLRREVDHTAFEDIDMNEDLPPKTIPSIDPSPNASPQDPVDGQT